MPINWNDIAERVARGMFGKQWDAEDAARQNLEEGKLRMELARSGDRRAEGNYQSEQEQRSYNRSRRGAQEEADAANLEGQRGRNRAQGREEETFAATGGARGAAERLIAEEKRKDTGIRIAGANSANDAKRLGLAREEFESVRGLRTAEERKAQVEADIAEATKASRISQIADPEIRDNQLLNSLTQLHKSYVQAGDEEGAKTIKQQIDGLLVRSVLNRGHREAVANNSRFNSYPRD